MNGVLGQIPQQLTTAEVNGHPVAVAQAHRRWTTEDYLPGAPLGERYEPVVVTVSAPVGLSLEDAVAVLFDWNMPGEDLADDDLVRELIAATVVGFGSLYIEEVRCGLGERVLDAGQARYLECCRERATAVFGGSGAGSPDRGRVLTGVS